ncbi:MAG: FAD-dependent oxidoreductase, partial [Desulfotomaculales bacterium]
MRFVIVGNGAAALGAVETLRRLDGGGDHRITVVTDEPVHAYARCLLPDVLAKKRSGASIALRPVGFYRRLGVDLLAGVAAVELRPGEKVLVLRDGREVGYDRLLVAVGAAPVLPELPVARLKTTPSRTKQNCWP